MKEWVTLANGITFERYDMTGVTRESDVHSISLMLSLNKATKTIQSKYKC
jgi:hypothetical protein